MHPTLCLSLLLFVSAAKDPDMNWPEFRGGNRAGVIEDQKLPDTWSTTKNVVWKVDLPGKGWSSPIIWGDKIFLTSVINEGNSEPIKKGLYFGGDRPKPPADPHRWVVYCLDWKTGKVIWEKTAHKGAPDSPIHLKNSYASETPVTDGQRLYAYFGNLGLFCYDLDGKELWNRKWGSFPMQLGWGTASSPVFYKGRVYVLNDNEKESFLTALDARTGEPIWTTKRADRSSWATPYIWENEKRTEIITCSPNKVRSYDMDGKQLWELTGMSVLAIPTPMVRFGMLFISSGYVLDKLKPIYAILPGAKGDITLKDGKTSNEFIVWSTMKGGPYNPSPIIYGDNLYVLYDQGMMSCYEAKTGKLLYDRERMGPGATAFTCSPWANDGKLFCLSEDGDTFVIKAGPKYQLLHKNSLDEMCMATPAVSRGNLIIRTLTKVYRIGAETTAANR